jgi:diadenosine tetraphosphate (Ap4A) HIT family hydrolase
VSSGWVVLGESQFLKGYALIYPDPVVPDLNALSAEARKTLMYEASVVGDALLEITGALRINYEILGNLAPALHVHVFPRFSNELAGLRTKPVWFYDWDSGPQFDAERDAPLMKAIREYLSQTGICI